MQIGVAMSIDDADRIVALLGEASPHCAACADLRDRIGAQLNIVRGVARFDAVRPCINCPPAPPREM
jgi:hypothetical protein